MGPPFPTAGILVILPELCAKLNASFQYLPEIKFAFKTAQKSKHDTARHDIIKIWINR